MKNLFKMIASGLWGFILEVFNASRADMVARLKNVALKAVSELNNGSLSNEEKRKEAFNRIKEYAIAQGMEVKDNIINLSLELAVAKIKG